jgi:DNA polymerase IIIc chi subunit
MSRKVSRQIVNQNTEKWDQAISAAKELLERVENRAARLKGAIETFTDLRNQDHEFSGPESAEHI